MKSHWCQQYKLNTIWSGSRNWIIHAVSGWMFFRLKLSARKKKCTLRMWVNIFKSFWLCSYMRFCSGLFTRLSTLFRIMFVKLFKHTIRKSYLLKLFFSQSKYICFIKIFIKFHYCCGAQLMFFQKRSLYLIIKKFISNYIE